MDIEDLEALSKNDMTLTLSDYTPFNQNREFLSTFAREFKKVLQVGRVTRALLRPHRQ